MKTFKDLTDEEFNEFNLQKEHLINEYKNNNKINNILLFGIGNFGNKVISKVQASTNVSKLYSDTQKSRLNEYNAKNTLMFLKDYEFSQGWKDINDYEDIYKKALEEKSLITNKVQNSDYIIICCASDNLLSGALAEAVADILKSLNKKFMICYSRENFFNFLPDIGNLSKERSAKFVKTMQGKNYLLNSFPHINADFVYATIPFNIYEISCNININSRISDFDEEDINTATFAKVLEMNINKMSEG